jgi:thiol:disulfide interchange protein DsbD
VKHSYFFFGLALLVSLSYLPGERAGAAEDFLRTTQAHSTAHFIFSQTGFNKSATVKAGLRIQLEPGWHTYWINPGDSGAPVMFDWKLPPGWKAGDLQFPLPERLETPPLQSFGYENEVVFFAELHPPAEGPNTAVVELEAEWLVCKDICIPAVHRFKAEISAVASPEPSAEATLFESAAANVPRDSKEVSGRVKIKGSEVEVTLRTPPDREPVDLFPAPKNLLSNQVPRITSGEQAGLWTLKLPLSRFGAKAPSHRALVKFKKSAGPEAVWVDLEDRQDSSWPFLFLAFVGGLLLNLMPCVFPIISMKFFSILKHGGGETRQIQKANGLYILGVLVSLWTLAFLLFFLREGGEALGWGFQLQSPRFVIFLMLVFALMAFNFLGWFEMQVQWAGMGRVLQNEGPLGHFLTGVLSTVVASPCTAPFMGVSIGFALSQPLPSMLLIFTALGLGLSFPYILLSIFPGWIRHLPKPGAWMEKLKTFMAFPLLATVIWLAWSLSFQVSSTTLAFVWVGILLLGFMIWVNQNLWPRSAVFRRAFNLLIGLLVLWLSFFHLEKASGVAAPATEAGIEWQKFSPELVDQLRRQGLPVFVDFTAAWCITCQVNKRVTFHDPVVVNLIKEKQMQMLIADWTNRDPVISRVLSDYGRAGVPLYLYYAKGEARAHILPEILTPSIFKKHIEALGF